MKMPDFVKRCVIALLSMERNARFGLIGLIGLFTLLVVGFVLTDNSGRLPFLLVFLVTIPLRICNTKKVVEQRYEETKNEQDNIKLKEMFPALLSLVRSDFNDVELLSADTHNSRIVFKLLDLHKLWTYIRVFSKDLLPNALAERAQGAFDASEKSYNEVLHQISDLGSRASQEGLHFVVVKGIALNDCIYGMAGTRAPGDIDILVDPVDAVAFHKLLEEMGFRQEVGPSSVRSLDRQGRDVMAIHASVSPDNTPTPIKMHQNKPEYEPYIKGELPAVEMHDGLYYLPYFASQTMLEDAIRNNGFCTLSLEHTFILLITNTYENSESFFSNTYDFKATLRDYVDIRYFFEKYHDVLDWNKITKTIATFEIEEIAGIILGNLFEVYGKDVSFGCLPSIEPLPSKWGVSILERMQDSDIARIAALRMMRERWLEAGKTSPIHVPFVFLYKTEDANQRRQLYTCKDGLLFTICRLHNNFVISFTLPPELHEKEEILCQFKFFPLDKSVGYTIYKVIIYYVDGTYKAYGHKTMKYDLGVIRKASGLGLAMSYEKIEEQTFIKVNLPFSEFEPLDVYKKNALCLSCGLYEKKYQEIYHKFEGNMDDDEIHLLAVE